MLGTVLCLNLHQCNKNVSAVGPLHRLKISCDTDFRNNYHLQRLPSALSRPRYRYTRTGNVKQRTFETNMLKINIVMGGRGGNPPFAGEVSMANTAAIRNTTLGWNYKN